MLDNKKKKISHYIVGEMIGKGAIGYVYKAFSSIDGKTYAIKQVYSENNKSIQINSIQSEIKLLKKLKHPNIVQYIDSIKENTDLYIILEYIENGSIYNILKNTGPLEENLCKIFVIKILEGLKYLHNLGIIHRDIKGANILLEKNGNLKLADFGVALHSSDVSKSMNLVGTPYWMSPEVIEKPWIVNTKSDIWSLGCTIIEMWTGNPPYSEWPQCSVIYKIVEEGSPPIPNNISDDCKDFLSKCFIVDIEKRYSSDQLLKHKWLNINEIYNSNIYTVDSLNNKPLKNSNNYNNIKILNKIKEISEKLNFENIDLLINNLKQLKELIDKYSLTKKNLIEIINLKILFEILEEKDNMSILIVFSLQIINNLVFDSEENLEYVLTYGNINYILRYLSNKFNNSIRLESAYFLGLIIKNDKIRNIIMTTNSYNKIYLTFEFSTVNDLKDENQKDIINLGFDCIWFLIEIKCFSKFQINNFLKNGFIQKLLIFIDLFNNNDDEKNLIILNKAFEILIVILLKYKLEIIKYFEFPYIINWIKIYLIRYENNIKIVESLLLVFYNLYIFENTTIILEKTSIILLISKIIFFYIDEIKENKILLYGIDIIDIIFKNNCKNSIKLLINSGGIDLLFKILKKNIKKEKVNEIISLTIKLPINYKKSTIKKFGEFILYNLKNNNKLITIWETINHLTNNNHTWIDTIFKSEKNQLDIIKSLKLNLNNSYINYALGSLKKIMLKKYLVKDNSILLLILKKIKIFIENENIKENNYLKDYLNFLKFILKNKFNFDLKKDKINKILKKIKKFENVIYDDIIKEISKYL